MSSYSAIEWTDATWNALVGCTKVSAGCLWCYAMVMAARIANAAQAALRLGKTITPTQAAYRRVVMWERGGKDAADNDDKALPRWNNRIELIEPLLTAPMRWTRPRRVFVNSMSDLFHPDVPVGFIAKVWAVMALTPRHTYQILTKRPERARDVLADALAFNRSVLRAALAMTPAADRKRVAAELGRGPWPLPNVWVGTTVEDQTRANERIPALLGIPAAIRFLSCEPLLGPVDLTRIPVNGGDSLDALQGEVCAKESGCIVGDDDDAPAIDWVIAGGESGHHARPSHPGWIRSLRDQCATAGVPFFFKQWGQWAPTNAEPVRGRHTGGHLFLRPDGSKGNQGEWWDGKAAAVDRFRQKKLAGRQLDGRTHDEFPAPRRPS